MILLSSPKNGENYKHQVWIVNYVHLNFIQAINKLTNIYTNNSKIITHFLMFVISLFLYLSNKVIAKWTFPGWLRISITISLPENMRHTNQNCNRSISRIQIFSKLLKSCLHQKIYTYFKRNTLFYWWQYGFSASRPSVKALDNLILRVIAWGDRSIYTCATLIDLTKTFHSASHHTVFQRKK